MMYRLVALKADQSVIGESKFPAFAIDRAIVAQLPDASLSNVDLEYEYNMLKNVFPDRFILLVSASDVICAKNTTKVSASEPQSDTSLVASINERDEAHSFKLVRDLLNIDKY